MSDVKEQRTHGDQSPNVITESGNVSITYSSEGWSPAQSFRAYISELPALLAAPRRFLNEQLAADNKLFAHGFLFLGISALLDFFLRMTPSVGSAIDWDMGMVSAGYYLINGLALGVVAFLACRVLGGRGSPKAHIAIFLFIAGASAVIFRVVSLATQVFVLLSAPEQFEVYREFKAAMLAGSNPEVPAAFAEGWILQISIALLVLGTLALLLWMATAWRAYGDLNGFGAGRLSLSLLLFLFFGFWVSVAMAALQRQIGIAIF